MLGLGALGLGPRVGMLPCTWLPACLPFFFACFARLSVCWLARCCGAHMTVVGKVQVGMHLCVRYKPRMPACRQPDLGAGTWCIRLGCYPTFGADADELFRFLKEFIFKQCCRRLEHALIPSFPDALPVHWWNRGLQASGGAPGQGSDPGFGDKTG